MSEEFKKWSDKEFEKFTEDSFLEEDDINSLWNYIKDYHLVSLSMKPSGEIGKDGNDTGLLVIKIKGGDY